MIFKSASQLSPTVEVSIDGVPVNYMTLQHISVEEKSGMHNLAILEFAGMNPQLIHQYLDVGITFSMELKNRDAFKFHGYITYLEPIAVTNDGVVNKSPFQTTRAYCFGTSYVMKSKNSRSWDNISLPELAVQIADKYKLSVSVPNDQYRFTRLAQTSQSDWQFLVQTAERLGYETIMEGTHIKIWDAYTAYHKNMSYSMLLTLRGARGDVSPQPGQILSFSGRIGAVTSDGARNSNTIHLLDKDGKLVSVSNETNYESTGLATGFQPQFHNVDNINADSFEMATKFVQGALRKKFPMTASVEIVADPGIHPGGIVSINEYNTEFDGFWYVQSVKHEITQSVMRTFLELGRDGMGTVPTNIKTTPLYTTPPEPVFVDNSWVSTKHLVDVY